MSDIHRSLSGSKRALALSIAMAAQITGVVAPAVTAHAETALSTLIAFNIPSQDLSSALVAFSRQAHVQLIVAPEDVPTTGATSISGTYTPEQALRKLLAGSGLGYKMAGPSTVVLQPQSRQAAPAINKSSTSKTPDSSKSYQIEEMTVTAQKREENLQAVPLAISALSGDQLDRLGITSYDGVANATPSISSTPFAVSSNVLVLYMRGQGNANPNMITTDGAVGLYENGFYIARPNATTFDLADLQRVEVLRGPQGSLWGRNTTGGAINLISKKPSGEFDFRQDFTYGTRNLFRSLTAIDLPKWGDVSTKLSVLKSGVDGYVKNEGSAHDFGEQRQLAGRFALHWDLMPSVGIDYFLEKGNLDSTPVYYQNDSLSGRIVGGVVYPKADEPATHTFKPINLDLSTSDFESHGLTVTWDLSDRLTIKSLTGYRKLNWDAFQDFAYALTAAPGVPLEISSEDLVHADQMSEELQFIGDISTRLKYVAGLYYFSETGSHAAPQTIVVGPTTTQQFRRVTADSDSKAIFGQLDWVPPILDDKLDITLGARFTKDSRSAERISSVNGTYIERGKATGAANDDDFSRFNPSLTLNYQWKEDLSTYLRIATGYRAGGSYEASPPGKFNQTFAPEKLTTYELGLKSFWFDRRSRINGAVFDSKYEDMQLVVGANPLNPAQQQVYNAGAATIKGAELSVLYAPIEDWSASLDYAYLDASFDKVKVIAGTIYDHNANSASPYVVGDDIKNLLTMPHAPRHAFTLGSDYTFLHFDGGSLFAHLDYRWQAKVYETASSGPSISNRDFGAQRAYGLLNGRVGMDLSLPRGDQLKFSLWGKNLAHKEYKQLVLPQGAAGVPLISGQTTGYTSQTAAWAEPPSFGIDLSYRY